MESEVTFEEVATIARSKGLTFELRRKELLGSTNQQTNFARRSGWSASYGDVLTLRRECEELRAQVEMEPDSERGGVNG